MEQETERIPTDNELGKAGWWRDLALLAILLMVAVGLRGWLLWNTEVPARDSIGFIRYALQFEGIARPPHTRTWADVIRNNHQHPGYPLAILATSIPVRYFMGGLSPYAMQLSAQLASGLAAILLVLPMYFLGKILVDRGVGFWGALLYQCLPVSGHILSDGLSEALFLLLCTTSLLCAAYAVRASKWWPFALCGAFCGLTYLVRPEGGLVLVATGMVLVAMQLAPRRRRRWGSFVACGTSLAAMAAVVGSPYVLITGHLTNKPSSHIMVGTYPVDPVTMKPMSALDRQLAFPRAKSPDSPSYHPLMASIVGVLLRGEDAKSMRLSQGLLAIAEELIRAFHYIGWFPALLGLWWYAGRARTVPGIWVVLVLCMLHTLVLWRLAVVVGYVSERHIQILVLAGCYPAVGVLRELPRWLVTRYVPNKTANAATVSFPSPPVLRGRGAGVRGTEAPQSPPPHPRPLSAEYRGEGRAAPSRVMIGASVLSFFLLVGLIAAGMPKTLQKLHANRAGYHAAGQWLANHIVHGLDEIADGHCWAHFYAGEVFGEGKPPSGIPGTRYLVIGRHKDTDGASAGADPTPTGEIVYHWPPQRPVEKADVVIYASPLPRPSLTNPSRS